MTSKTCTKCGKEKPLEAFVIDARRKDGRRSCCKECSNRAATVNRERRRIKLGIIRVETKQCQKCKQVLSADQFHRKPGTSDGLQSFCKSCQKEWQRQHRRRKLAENPEWETHQHLMKTYGISYETYQAMEVAQNHKCAICGSEDPKTRKRIGATRSRFCVDHDHKTGKIRALLCAKCNRGIGLLGDDPIRLEAAAKYLREHNG